jgi:predicted amidophosphoribosyltransferase
MRSGILKRAIDLYKYENCCAWSLIFGRVLAGYLIANSDQFLEIDLIVGSPTFTSPGGRREWDHIRTILEKTAEQLDPGEWPIDLDDPLAIVQTVETPHFMGKTWKQKYEIAIGPLRSALSVPNPSVIKGKRILVFDDVFTDGLHMNEVARALRLQGQAKTISGLVLARQPFRGVRNAGG